MGQRLDREALVIAVVWIVSGALAVALMLGNPDNPGGALIGVILSGCLLGVLERREARKP